MSINRSDLTKMNKRQFCKNKKCITYTISLLSETYFFPSLSKLISKIFYLLNRLHVRPIRFPNPFVFYSKVVSTFYGSLHLFLNLLLLIFVETFFEESIRHCHLVYNVLRYCLWSCSIFICEYPSIIYR